MHFHPVHAMVIVFANIKIIMDSRDKTVANGVRFLYKNYGFITTLEGVRMIGLIEIFFIRI